MTTPNQVYRLSLLGILILAGCTSTKSGTSPASSHDLGILARNDAPAEVAAVRTFYVQPNVQPAMGSSFVVGVSLHEAFSDRIASGLTAKGLTQAPPGMADVTVVFTVHNPTPPTTGNIEEIGNDFQGLSSADQLLSEADAMQSSDNFLDRDRVDLRIRIISAKTKKPIWRGSVAGVLAANEDARGRLIDVLDAVDRLLDKYPHVPK